MLNSLEACIKWGRRIYFFKDHLGMPENYPEHVVEVRGLRLLLTPARNYAVFKSGGAIYRAILE